jgi:8-oxo-dGTP pyrophosphatase MutT (NUDIX family)
MIKEFTASSYILYEEKILLLFHPKLKKWLPPGGHLEENETPEEAAIREVFEETGLLIEIIEQENLHICHHNGKSIPRPYLCLLENIPEYKEFPAHQHIDFIYVARPLDTPTLTPLKDHPLRWFTQKEIQELIAEKEIFTETQEVIDHLFSSFSSAKIG